MITKEVFIKKWSNFWHFQKHKKEFDLAFEKELNEIIQTNNSGWISVNNSLPKPLETVWISDGETWVALGCLVQHDEGYCWAESNGVIYVQNNEIVSECEEDDLNVVKWHPLPRL